LFILIRQASHVIVCLAISLIVEFAPHLIPIAPASVAFFSARGCTNCSAYHSSHKKGSYEHSSYFLIDM
jgi:hypothetical protein